MRDAARGIQSLNERSQEISKVAKTVEDLAHRTNMIALNASIQANEVGERGHGFALVAEEFEKLAARADGTNRQISTLNKSILAEINKVETSLETSIAEVSNLSRFAIETANVLSELERYVGQFLNLQENLISYSQQQSEETDEAFQTFVKSIGETEVSVSDLKDSALSVKNLSNTMRNLQLMISEYRIIQDENTDSENGFVNFSQEKEQMSGEDEAESELAENEHKTVEDKEQNSTYEESANEDFAFDQSVSMELENNSHNPDDQKFEEFSTDEFIEDKKFDTDEFIEDEFNSTESNPNLAETREDAADFDDLQIEETKISYDTGELSLEIKPDSPIPSYEEI
jgi:hypothetical protein